MQGNNTIALTLEKNRLLGPVFEHLLALQKFCESNDLPFPPAELLELFPSAPAPSKNGSTVPKRGPDKQPRAPYTKPKPKPFNFQLPEPPDYGPRPEGAGSDWVAVPLDGASALSLVLYIIKELGGAAPSSAINTRLSILRSGTGKSTSSMSLNELKYEGKVSGDYRQWTLTADVKIAISGERMWCAVEQLRNQDRSSLRREVILAALRVNSRMTVVDISECLRRCDWLKGVAVESDQVKGNLVRMEKDGSVEREGAFWKLKA